MRTTTSINLRNNWHHADHNFNQPAEQLASSGPQLQSTSGTIGIMRCTTSINLRTNWHHADHNFNQPAEQLVSSLCGFPYPEAKIGRRKAELKIFEKNNFDRF